jgi:hypothetical protein
MSEDDDGVRRPITVQSVSDAELIELLQLAAFDPGRTRKAQKEGGNQ